MRMQWRVPMVALWLLQRGIRRVMLSTVQPRYAYSCALSSSMMKYWTSILSQLENHVMQSRMRAISDIVNALVQGIKSGNDVDLNKLNRDVGIKYSLARLPKLVEIIAALPDEHRAALLPQYVLFFLLLCSCTLSVSCSWARRLEK